MKRMTRPLFIILSALFLTAAGCPRRAAEPACATCVVADSLLADVDTLVRDSVDPLPPRSITPRPLPPAEVIGQKRLFRQFYWEPIDRATYRAAERRVRPADASRLSQTEQIDSPSGRFRAIESEYHRVRIWQRCDSADMVDSYEGYRLISGDVQWQDTRETDGFWDGEEAFYWAYEGEVLYENGEYMGDDYRWDHYYVRFTTRDDPGALLQSIDSVGYFAARERYWQEPPRRRRVTDFDSVKRMLAGRAFFGERYPGGPDDLLKIILPNGQTHPITGMAWSGDWFCAYYPDEDVLLLSDNEVGGSLCSVDMKTGAYVGDPDSWLESPSGLHRLNCYWTEAREGSIFYVEHKVDGRYRGLGESVGDQTAFIDIEEAFWVDDHTLYFRQSHIWAVTYGNLSGSSDGDIGFYRLALK